MAASAAASNHAYPPAIPLGGLPMLTRPVGSYGCHVQVPSAVPTISRPLTTTKAAAYSSGRLPHRANANRQPHQNAPSASGRGDSSTPQAAHAPQAVIVAVRNPRACRCAQALRPSASAAR